MLKNGLKPPVKMPTTDFNMNDLEQAMSYDDDDNFDEDDEEDEDCSFPELSSNNRSKSLGQKAKGHLESETLMKAL
jgi:hypothetical protein